MGRGWRVKFNWMGGLEDQMHLKKLGVPTDQRIFLAKRRNNIVGSLAFEGNAVTSLMSSGWRSEALAANLFEKGLGAHFAENPTITHVHVSPQLTGLQEEFLQKMGGKSYNNPTGPGIIYRFASKDFPKP